MLCSEGIDVPEYYWYIEKRNFMDWYQEAEITAAAFLKENPNWDKDTLIAETMECVELEMMEELSFIEEHLDEFLEDQTNSKSKNETDENE